MAKKKVNQVRDPHRRQSILDAALILFTQNGYNDTTLAAICEKSGSSVGSVYHFFSGKEEIAFELIKQAIEGWTAEATTLLVDPRDPKTAIQNSVSSLLIWANKNEDLFYFMEEMRTKTKSEPTENRFKELFSSGQAKAENLFENWRNMGLVRDISWSLAYSFIMGPAYLHLRMKPVGKKLRVNDIRELAESAWSSVRN